MKKFFKWFKNSTKIKRWLFLIIIGMILVCFGFSKIQAQEQLKIIDLLQIVITFVAGFVCFVVGIIYIQRRTLEIALETNQIEINKENYEVKKNNELEIIFYVSYRKDATQK